MTLSRRSLIKSGAAAAAATAASGPIAAASAMPALVVFDGRSPLSRAFANTHFAPVIDVAIEDDNLWRTLRSAAPTGSITGMTGWSDWVVVRGLLEEKGKRLKSEKQSGTLFLWTMA
jgi:hypothetical protein